MARQRLTFREIRKSTFSVSLMNLGGGVYVTLWFVPKSPGQQCGTQALQQVTEVHRKVLV